MRQPPSQPVRRRGGQGAGNRFEEGRSQVDKKGELLVLQKMICTNLRPDIKLSSICQQDGYFMELTVLRGKWSNKRWSKKCQMKLKRQIN